jgi:hypothetical protein
MKYIKRPAVTIDDAVQSIQHMIATLNTLAMQSSSNDLNPHYMEATKSYEAFIKINDDNELEINTDLGLFASITERDHSLNECLDLPVGYVIDDSYSTVSNIKMTIDLGYKLTQDIKDGLKKEHAGVLDWYGETDESKKAREEARYGHDNS